jgi:hypothetical protein
MYSREQLSDDIAVRREQLMHRAAELREEFADHVDQEVVTNFAGWTLISTGLALGVTKWMRGSRGLGALVMPIGFIIAGAAVLGGGTVWQRRAMHIGEAEMRVRAELSSLDPLARMQVLRHTAQETLPLVKRVSFRN